MERVDGSSGKHVTGQRVFSLFDGFAYGVYANSIVIAAALTYSLLWPWPKANIPIGILMVCLAFVPAFTVYAMLTSLMPRIGGDYFWQTRTLGVGWGVVLIFTPLLLGPWFYMASNVAPGSAMVVAPLLISLARLLDAPLLVDLAINISTRTGTWWFYVAYVTFAAGVMLLGMRFYARLQRISFTIGMICLAMWIMMLLRTDQAGFHHSFDRFMQEALHWGNHRAFQQILDTARTQGFAAVPLDRTTLGESFLIGPALTYTFMYVAWTGTLVGEIRGVGRLRNALLIFQGGNIFSMAVCSLFMWLLLSRVTNEFFTSANFLWATGQGQFVPVPPHTGLFLMALGRSPWYWLSVAVGLNAWFWIWPTNNIVMSTRVMFAMSQDRLLPAFVTRISPTWGTPVFAIAICYFGALIMGWLYFFTGFARLTLNMPFMTSIAFAATTLAGTLFPYLGKTRPLYESSPLSRYRLFGLPLITVCGVLGLAYFAILFSLYLTDSSYNTNDPLSACFVLGSLGVSALACWRYRRFRLQKGTDLAAVMRVIPSD